MGALTFLETTIRMDQRTSVHLIRGQFHQIPETTHKRPDKRGYA